LIRKYQRCKETTVRESLAVEFICAAGPDLERYICFRRPREDGKDAYQETLMAIAAGLQRVEAGSDAEVWAWAYGITRKKISDQFRGRQMRRATIVDTSLLRESLQAVHDDAPFTGAQRADLEEAISLLTTSSPPCVHYLWDRHVVGLTFVELGKEYEVTEEAARKRVERCLKLAQDLIAG
jgi:RNA polymerase sigma factor (sigma-70 family)